jgi:hypothetical protein
MNRGLPASSTIAEANEEFKNYQYRPELQSWTHKLAKSSLQSHDKNGAKAPELVKL